MGLTTLQRIEAFNAGRDAELLELKYAEMSRNAFSFFRGSCHLFYEDLPAAKLPKAPLGWCCGDLHLGNFGSYKGNNRLTYFDINDFDECCRAPLSWDLVRFLASVAAAGETEHLEQKTVQSLCSAFLDSYQAALGNGKPRWLERATSEGMIRELLLRVKKRSRKKFLNLRTEFSNGERRLVMDQQKTRPLLPGKLAMIRKAVTKFARQQPTPEFYRVIDAARRIAGTGSLGLERYILLVEGRGGPNGNFLLDLKYQSGSSVIRRKRLQQPAWACAAERVAATQQMIQAVAPALLNSVEMDGGSWLLREMQPTADRLDIEKCSADLSRFSEMIRTLGEVVAWGHLRGAGRRGASGVEELIAFGRSNAWKSGLLQVARGCGRLAIQQSREFSAALAARRTSASEAPPD